MLKPNIPTKSPEQLCTVTLLGNLVTTPDIRYRANPVLAITEITIATNSKWLDKKNNKYKEWATYHQVKVAGSLVEKSLLHANRGDIILVQGYLNNIKPVSEKAQKRVYPDIVHANFIQKYNKGYTQAINQINCSAQLISQPQLMLTEHNINLAQAKIIIHQHIYSHEKENWLTLPVERTIHVWGKSAKYLNENAKIGDDLVIEGKLNYESTAEKSQFIEVKKLHLFNN